MVQSTEASRLDAVNCVLWDLDGTLTDSIADICASLNVVLEQSGLSAVSVDEARTMVGLGAGKLLQRAFTHVGGEAQYDAEPAYASFIAHYRDNCCVHTTLFNGVRDVLDTLHQRGFRQGVCTNKPEQMASKIIADLGLGDYFGVVVGGDSTSRRKPDAEPVQACLNVLQVSTHSAVMIGDSPADAGCAIAAGIPVILVDWGYTDAALDELGAEQVLSDIAVLPGILPAQA
jgi:phosphoglycolate phosphatase